MSSRLKEWFWRLVVLGVAALAIFGSLHLLVGFLRWSWEWWR